ncbi:MAG: hypothetical protein ACXQTW_02660 [Candidatus Methanospirareceae archaeon]
MAEAEVKKVLALVPELLEVPYPRIWERGEIIGFTVLNASRRRREYGHGV